MKQFVIILNQIEGVDLILKALDERSEEKGCLASSDLARGIRGHLHQMDVGNPMSMQPITLDDPDPEPEPTKPKFGVIDGGKKLN